MVKKKVIIVGAGGHAKVVADIILRNGDEILGFLDGINPNGSFIGYNKLGVESDYKKYTDAYFIVAIGDPYVREKIVQQMNGVKWYTAIHPSAQVSTVEVSIGEGTVVMANAIISSGAKIGKHCILNSACIVEHDNILEDYVHISVGAKMAGSVVVGMRTLVGIGATVSNKIKIVNDCIIGAGAVVVKNIEESGVYVGIPAKKRESV